MEQSTNRSCAAAILLSLTLVISGSIAARAFASVAIPKVVTSAWSVAKEERTNLMKYHEKADEARAKHVAPLQNQYRESQNRLDAALRTIVQNGYSYDFQNDKVIPFQKPL